MEQLYGSGVNRHGGNTKINNLVPIFESYDEEVTKTRNKIKRTPVMLLSEYEYEDKNKRDQREDNE